MWGMPKLKAVSMFCFIIILNSFNLPFISNAANIVIGLLLNIDPANSSSYSGVGNTIYDLSGFGNTGTLTNGPTFSALNGGSLVLDGSNDYVSVNNNANILPYTAYTKIAYIYISNFSIFIN